MKTFAEFLKPLRQRLQELGQQAQMTLVFDAGASSQNNLESLESDYYVTSLRPSYHGACCPKGRRI